MTVSVLIRSILARALVVALLWLSVTEAAVSALGYGAAAVPVVVAATYLLTGRPSPSAARVGATVRRIGGVSALAGWVLWRSLVGGLDVARRTLWMPRADISPRWISYETSLASPAARVALMLVANLMPGTLTANLDGDIIEVHVISGDLDAHGALADLERRIARVQAPAARGGSAHSPS